MEKSNCSHCVSSGTSTLTNENKLYLNENIGMANPSNKLELTEENLDYLLRQEYTLSQMCYEADQMTLEVLDKSKNHQKVTKSNGFSYSHNNAKEINTDENTEIKENSPKQVDFKTSQTVVSTFLDGLPTDSIMETSENCLPTEVQKLMLCSPRKFMDIGMNAVTYESSVNLPKIASPESEFCINLRDACKFSSEDNLLEVASKFGKNLLMLESNESFKEKIEEQCMAQIITNIENGTYKSRKPSLIESISLKEDDIEYIDKEEDIESAISAVPLYKTDSKDSKMTKTFSTSKILELEDHQSNFSDLANVPFRRYSYDEVVPAKSSLKRKISQINNKKNKVKKSGLKFTNITIFYFERSQGFSSIPTKGGSTLGMAIHHFYISTLSIDEYEHKKIRKELPKLRNNNIIYHRRSDIRGTPRNVQALSVNQRIELLESSEVSIEIKEEDDCSSIRSSRASAGCDCKDYCDPEVCFCNLSGIECQVDRPNFPCGCSRENCRNVIGRSEYNHNKVRTHFIKTMKKIKLENKARGSRRKQLMPTKILANDDAEIPSDDNMIEY